MFMSGPRIRGSFMSRSELDQVFGTASAYFAVMSHVERLKILHAICSQDKPVTDIVAEVGAARPVVLRHLAAMRRHGVVEKRKASGQDVYGVADTTMVELCRTLCRQMGARLARRDSSAQGVSGVRSAR